MLWWVQAARVWLHGSSGYHLHESFLNPSTIASSHETNSVNSLHLTFQCKLLSMVLDYLVAVSMVIIDILYLPTSFIIQWCLYLLTSSANRRPGKLTYWFISWITVLYESWDKRFVNTARFIDLTFRSASKRVNIRDDIDGWMKQKISVTDYSILFKTLQTKL